MKKAEKFRVPGAPLAQGDIYQGYRSRNFTVQGIPVSFATNEEELGTVLACLDRDTLIGADMETSGFSHLLNSPGTLQLYGEQTGTLALIRLNNGFSRKIVDFLQDRRHRTIWHNGVGFDWLFLRAAGCDFYKLNVVDTLIGEEVVADSGRANISRTLDKSITRRLGGVKIKKEYDHSGSWMADMLTDQQLDYALSDVVALPALWHAQLERARQMGGKVLQALDLEMELAPLVAEMEWNGIPVDVPAFRGWQDSLIPERDAALEAIYEARGEIETIRQKEAEYQEALAQREHEDYEQASFLLDNPGKKARRRAKPKPPEKFNPNSSKQVLKWFEENGVPLQSTDAEQMAKLWLGGGKAGAMADLILRFRLPNHALSNYPPDFLERRLRPDGKLGYHLKQAGTSTGRFSCSNDNLQQIPKNARYIFGAFPGWAFVDGDYSQIEVVCAADISGDKNLSDAVRSGLDLHLYNASIMYDCPLDQVTKVQRRNAKACTFGLVFGGSALTLATNSIRATVRAGARETETMPLETAEWLSKTFFEKFQGMNAFKEHAYRQAQYNRGGSLQLNLPTGLIRVLRGADLKPTTIMNTLVQGTAAAGIKYALLEAKSRGLGKRICLPIHDEVLLHAPLDEAHDIAREMRESMLIGMSRAIDLPARVEFSIGKTWGSDEYGEGV